MDAIEKLREKLRVCGCDPDECLGCSVPREISEGLDEIERELADKYQLLPLDADGETIRLGDRMEVTAPQYPSMPETFEVTRIGFDVGGAFVAYGMGSFKPTDLRHVKPDPLKELFRECVMNSMCVARVVSGTPVLGVDEAAFGDWYYENADKARELIGVGA